MQRLLLLLAFAASRLESEASGSCEWQPDFVSANAKPVHSEVVTALDSSTSIKDVVARIGPAVRDVGSGLYILDWRMENGAVLRVSASDACSVPKKWRIVKP